MLHIVVFMGEAVSCGTLPTRQGNREVPKSEIADVRPKFWCGWEVGQFWIWMEAAALEGKEADTSTGQGPKAVYMGIGVQDLKFNALHTW